LKRKESFDDEEDQVIKKKKSSSRKPVLSWRATSTLLALSITGIALFRLSRDAFVSKAMALRIDFVHEQIGLGGFSLYR